MDLTNTLAIAAGHAHAVVLRENGTLVQWGKYWNGGSYLPLTNAPSGTDFVAVAAGSQHDLALKADGTVTNWGLASAYGNNSVPTGLTGVKAIAAGYFHNVALLTNGMVTAWGYNALGLTNVPTGLSNVTAISAAAYHSLALRAEGTVVGWGYSPNGETNVPSGLTNVVAIAAGGFHNLALTADGKITAWGLSDLGQTNVPSGQSNFLAVAAGYKHSAALKNDGTVVVWGDTSAGQTNVPNTLKNVKLLAAGGYYTLAGVFSSLVEYPVDVTQDLLLIANTNSADSTNVMNYYLAQRPMVSGANVLRVGGPPGEFIGTNDFVTLVEAPLKEWLTNNPTKHPNYIILFLDIPSRLTNVNLSLTPTLACSVSFALRTRTVGIPPFITHINMDGTNDCFGYINKLRDIGTNYSPGKVILSASASGTYANKNYVVDSVRVGYSSDGAVVANATNGLSSAGVPAAAIQYLDGVETTSSLPHLTNAANVAGYISWGAHSSLGGFYAVDGKVQWTGQSRWWIIETVESFNGVRDWPQLGHFPQWFSANAFGGTNYQNTPVGAVTHVEEPGLGGVNDADMYFRLWAGGKLFAPAAWVSRNTVFLQVVGDPLVRK